MVGALALSVLASGCGGSSPAVISYPTPQATVIAYYRAVGAQRWSLAESLVQPSLRVEDHQSPDSDENNTVSVSHIDIRGGGAAPGALPSNQRAGYHDLWQVVVAYDAVYKKVITEESGPQFRFIYLGRADHTGRWTILENGTGP